MELTRDSSIAKHQIHWCRDDAIGVDQLELRQSFLIAPDQLQLDWPVSSVQQLDASHIEPILAMQPELVLIGSGIRQRWPAQAVLAALLTRGIGVEVMDNHAAARTYTLLAGEGRRVVAAFMLG